MSGGLWRKHSRVMTSGDPPTPRVRSRRLAGSRAPVGRVFMGGEPPRLVRYPDLLKRHPLAAGLRRQVFVSDTEDAPVTAH